MSILSRVTRLFKADMHGVMDQLEDKKLLIKQYLREMESSLQDKEKELQQMNERIKANEHDCHTCEQEIEKLEKDLLLVLRKEKDDIARMLIRKQQIQKMHLQRLQKQSELLVKQKEELAKLLGEQRLKYETLRAKAASHIENPASDVFDAAETALGKSELNTTINEEEIEIELIRRKEKLQKEETI